MSRRPTREKQKLNTEIAEKGREGAETLTAEARRTHRNLFEANDGQDSSVEASEYACA